MGLIPKSRIDRLLKLAGLMEEMNWRTISDMKKVSGRWLERKLGVPKIWFN